MSAVLAVALSFTDSRHACFKGKIGNLLICNVQLCNLKDLLCFFLFPRRPQSKFCYRFTY